MSDSLKKKKNVFSSIGKVFRKKHSSKSKSMMDLTQSTEYHSFGSREVGINQFSEGTYDFKHVVSAATSADLESSSNEDEGNL